MSSKPHKHYDLSNNFRVRDLFEIIFEDADFLVVNKPAGLVCHPTKDGERSSLIGRIRLYLGGNSTAHLINRLDRETSGVVLAAKNAVTAGRLGKLWETRAVVKQYLAIVHGGMQQDKGLIELSLGKDVSSEITIKDCVRADGAKAVTAFEVERRFNRPEGAFTLLRVTPKTGRKHQIRIHLAAIGHAIVGDKLYGSDPGAYLAFVQHRLTASQRRNLILANHALHAQSLRLPWAGLEQVFQAEAGEEFRRFLPLP